MRVRVCFGVVLWSGCAASQPSMVQGPSGPVGPVATIAAAPLQQVDGAATWQRSSLPANTSRLMVGDARQLPLEHMDMRVQVEGFRARVLVDFVFFNPDEAIYEGTFQMRLPDEASPYFLAFGQGTAAAPAQAVVAAGFSDMFSPRQIMERRAGEWISAREARVVPRSLASAAYSETVRPRLVRVVVDPALSQWAGAGVFNTRVFPIAGRTRHRVVFGYDVDLAPSGPDLALELPVPADVASVAVELEVAAGTRVVPAGAGVAVGERVHHRFDQPRGSIVVRVADGTMRMHGEDAVVGPLFAVRATPTLPEAPAMKSRSRAIFAVDTSLSSNPVRYNLWLGLLRDILAANRGQLEEFAVVFFNVDATWWQPTFVANTPDNAAAALAFAGTRALEGATDVGAALAQTAAPPWPATGAWDVFLLSDGAATWGEDDARVVAQNFNKEMQACADGGCPAGLFAYRTHGVGVDPRLLGMLTRETGGAMFSVDGEAAAVRVATAHRRRPWSLAGVQVDGGEDVLVAGRPQTVSVGQPLVVVGRGAPAAGAKLRLTLRQGAVEKKVVVDVGPGSVSTLAPRVYGQVVVDQLEEVSTTTHAMAEIYARYFRVVGQTCSLLMLEREEDYARLGVGDDPTGVMRAMQQHRPVGETIEATAQARGREDPRAAVVRMMADVGTRTGAVIDERVVGMITRAPVDALVVASVPLQAKDATWAAIPELLRPQLARQDVEEQVLWVNAGERRVKLGAADGLKALSSLAELRPGDDALLRGLGLTALAWRLPDAAYHLLRRAAELPPYDPVVHHLMAIALAQLGKPELAIVHFEIALAQGWEPRFGGYREAVLMDYLRFLASPGRVEAAMTADLVRTRGEQLAAQAGDASPLVVTLHWSGDDADVDLHVIEPDGSDCHYGARETAHGVLGVDATDGYGPELYRLRDAVPGTYYIAAKLFSGARHRTSTRVQAMVSVYRGRDVERHVVTLEPGKTPMPITTVVLP